MNAEELIGTVLGTSTLQKLIGQGGMGAVYLAQQSRPRRQVAVKVLMPATALKPHQLSAFLERFRRETDAAASLEHPNIMPVYGYGEQDGLAYLVMPYISGGTLRDVMEREGQMSLEDALSYLEQMAEALDFAHAHGVIHRDIKPANILVTTEGRLLLTDFGLVKLLSEHQPEQMRLTGAGAPVGTPDYMSPEQVIGGEVDGRADQYSLGIVLFQMLTSTTPFQGETPMQIASQQLHMQPPAPRLLRQDLPEAAEQVLLRAMAKRPEERFNTSQEFALAFRAALTQQSMQPDASSNRGGLLTNAGVRKGSLFDPKWQSTGIMPVLGTAADASSPISPLAAPAASLTTDTDSNMAMPRPGGTGLLSKAGLFPRLGKNTSTVPVVKNAEANQTGPTGLFSTGKIPATTGMQPGVLGRSSLFGPLTGKQHAFSGQSAQMGTQQDTSAQQTGFQSPLSTQPTGTTQQFSGGDLQQLSPAQSMTSALTLLNAEQRSGNTIKLTGPVKVVQVPVAPGQYVTGLLPVQKEMTEQTPEPPISPISKTRKSILLLAVLLLLVGALGGGIALMRSRSSSSSSSQSTRSSTSLNLTATAMAQATATVAANVILSDSLSQNIHNFPISNSGAKQYVFKDGAYHITNAGDNAVAVALQDIFPETTLGYQLTMEEIKGDDTSPVNTFGMILRYRQNNTTETFYTFEILNQNDSSDYGFYKYDSSKTDPWNQLWHTNTGKEFHRGQGSKATNVVKVFADGSVFTFYVNGQKVGSFKDGTFPSGSMGMLVNLKGTEVAFSNMLITRS